MLESGYFDSEIIGYDEEGMPEFDRAQTSDFLAMFISQIISDGVLALPGDCFQVIAYDGLKIKVRPGFGVIKGRFVWDKEEFELEILPGHPSYRRIDRVIFRANYLERLCEIIIREGEPAEKPVAPELIRPAAGDYYELCLATVSVAAKQVVVTQANITDTRYDSRVCGLVTQVIDHLDTSVFAEQLNAWYQNMTEEAERNLENWFIRFTSWFESTKEQFEGAIDNANEQAASAEAAALRLNDFITNVEEQIAAGFFNGPQGPQGIQGPKGDKGDRGDSGIVVPVSGMFTLSGDGEGNLWAYYADSDSPPSFEYNPDTGDIFYITPEE